MAFEFVGQFCSLWIYFHPERNEKGKENYLYRLKESFSKTSLLLLIGERNASLCYSNFGECARQDILVTANFHANTLAWNKKFPIYPICAKNEPTLHHEWSELWWISLWISHEIVQLCRAEIFIFLCFTRSSFVPKANNSAVENIPLNFVPPWLSAVQCLLQHSKWNSEKQLFCGLVLLKWIASCDRDSSPSNSFPQKLN